MDSKRLKVKITVSVQLQRAINDIRRWIRVLSSETIGHLKKNNCLFCNARSWRHVIRNYAEKVTLDVGNKNIEKGYKNIEKVKIKKTQEDWIMSASLSHLSLALMSSTSILEIGRATKKARKIIINEKRSKQKQRLHLYCTSGSINVNEVQKYT